MAAVKFAGCNALPRRVLANLRPPLPGGEGVNLFHLSLYFAEN